MTRQQKIEILKAIASGKATLKDLLPFVEVTIIHISETDLYCSIDKNGNNETKFMPVGKLARYLQEVRTNNPECIVKTITVSLEDFNRISAELETGC